MAEQDGPGKEGQERRECWMKVERRDGAQGGQVMTRFRADLLNMCYCYRVQAHSACCHTIGQ